MKFTFKRIILFFLIFSQIIILTNFVYSVDGACCYDSSGGDIYPFTSSDSCPSGDFKVGKYDRTNPDPNQRFCRAYENKQVGCLVGDVCYDSVLGKKLYDIPLILGLEDFDSYCENFISISDSRCGLGLEASIPISTGDTGSSNNGGSGSVFDFENIFNETSTADKTRNLCSESGSPFGFYVTKESCEAIELAGENSCLFNPYLGGRLNSYYSNYGDLGLDFYENSCIPKSEINVCYDYKTKDNCELNPAKEFSSSLEYGCNWIDSKEFSGNIFDKKGGICISKGIDEFENYDEEFYSFRLNLISNPSFEDSVNNSIWILDENKIIFDTKSYHKNYFYKLSSNSQISQEIFDLSSEIFYSVSLYARINQSLSSNSNLKILITGLDSNGVSTFENTVVLKKSLSEIFINKNVFERLDFNNYKIDTNSNFEKVKFTIISENLELDVDAISFEPYLSEGVVVSDNIFKPVEILTSKASTCNLCFDDLKLNLCTETKSNILGDCSYMVTSPKESYTSKLQNYTGSQSNLFSKNEPWESQSLANSNLFCEMYINENNCEDPDNFVNTKFGKENSFSGETLCKWDASLGCFKDSDNNNLPDTIQGVPNVRAYKENLEPIFLDYLNYYRFSKDTSTNANSDFALACDSLPPNSYIYFTAKTLTGEDVLITEGLEEMVGAVTMHLSFSDSKLESCLPYDINRKLFVDYEITNTSGNKFNGVKEYNSNVLKGDFLAQNYFTDINSKSILFDGENDISIIVKDQSGNFNKNWKFNLNVDAKAPEVKLINYNKDDLLDIILGPSTYFNFSITDYSNVTSCNYNLIPYSNVDPTFYSEAGEIDLSNHSKENPYVKFKLPIFNTTSNLNSYDLEVSCVDLFGQTSSNIYSFNVDFSTEVIVLEPLSFSNYLLDLGFLNSENTFTAVSSEFELNYCTLDFENSDIRTDSNLEITQIPDGLELEQLDNLGYDGINFYNLIEGNINFATDGIKKGKVVCEDVLGNIFEENLVYYYDTEKPNLLDYSLDGVVSNTNTSYVDENNNYYTHSSAPGILNLSIDGTNSWVGDSTQIKFADNNGIVEDITHNFLSQVNLKNDSFVGNLLIPLNLGGVVLAYNGVETEEENLREIILNVNYTDKAKNWKTDNVSFLYDVSIPKLNFGGDVAQSSFDPKIIFSSKNNPNIILSFNAPSYRKYTCKINTFANSVPVTREFEGVNNLQFKLKDLSETLVINKDKSVPLEIKCSDVYGINLNGIFNLKYDNTAPILRAIFLDNGNEKFYKNVENARFSDIIDNLVFDLVDTGEVGYVCSYAFESTQYYSCNESIRTVEFDLSGYQNTETLKIVKGTTDTSDNLKTPICVRNSAFTSAQASTAKNGQELSTNLVVRGVCEDMVGFESIGKEINVEINYILSELASLDLKYEEGFAYPIVKSFAPFNPVIISLDPEGKDILVSLNTPTQEGDLYVYESVDGIDLSLFENGVNVIYAIAQDSSGGILDRIAKSMTVDNGKPKTFVTVPDEQNGIVYSSEFEVLFGAQDSEGTLDKVELYLDDSLIYSSQNVSNYNKNVLREPDSSLNLFSFDLQSYDGQLTFKSGQIDRRYKFTVKAYDSGGNINSSNIDVSIRDGVSITLLDSQSAFVDPGKFSWITKDTTPVLSFKTSKLVSSCDLYPYTDDRWFDVYGDNVQKSFTMNSDVSNTDLFSFDLSSLENYDVSLTSGKSSFVKVVCLYNKSYYNYTREIKYIDYLPDYVLTSSEGFVLNEEPYQSLINVKSVGPYRYITCDYRIDGGGYEEFSNQLGTVFDRLVDFSTRGTGEHTLNLQCRDIVGNIGPQKEYKFLITKGAQLELEDINLKLDEKIFTSNEEDSIYVSNLNNLDLSFKLNKKNDVSCNYVINPTGGFITGSINYLKNLLSIGTKDITTSNVYEYNVEGLDFENNENILRISCSTSGTGDKFDKEYSVIYDDSVVDVDVERVAIE